MSKKLTVTLKNLTEITPYPANAKLHPPEQINHIAKSITEFGFNDPIAIDSDGEIIAGHGRYLASKLLKLDKVPVIVLDGLTDAQKRAYRLRWLVSWVFNGWI